MTILGASVGLSPVAYAHGSVAPKSPLERLGASIDQIDLLKVLIEVRASEFNSSDYERIAKRRVGTFRDAIHFDLHKNQDRLGETLDPKGLVPKLIEDLYKNHERLLSQAGRKSVRWSVEKVTASPFIGGPDNQIRYFSYTLAAAIRLGAGGHKIWVENLLRELQVQAVLITEMLGHSRFTARARTQIFADMIQTGLAVGLSGIAAPSAIDRILMEQTLGQVLESLKSDRTFRAISRRARSLHFDTNDTRSTLACVGGVVGALGTFGALVLVPELGRFIFEGVPPFLTFMSKFLGVLGLGGLACGSAGYAAGYAIDGLQPFSVYDPSPLNQAAAQCEKALRNPEKKP